MTKGTDFGGIHSSRDLHLIQQKVDVQPAEPKLNLIDIPGANGSKDLSEQPAGRLVYNDRTLTWTFALYPGEKWHDKHRQVSNALNGKRCQITLDDDPGRYYTGRLAVRSYNTDKALRQITVEATCSPWVMKHDLTVVTQTFANANIYEIELQNERKPAVPTIELTHPASVIFDGKESSLPAGSFTSLDIELQPGSNRLLVKFPDGEGTITITYQEGSL